MVHYLGSLYTVLFVFNIVLFSVASGHMMERIVMKTPEDTDFFIQDYRFYDAITGDSPGNIHR